jgi:CRISPR-associated endonuclease/helicase Cas3
LRFILESDDVGVTRWLQVDKWHHEGELEEDRSIAHKPQLLDEHQSWAEDEARMLTQRLNLPVEYREALQLAARLHDEGKRATCWQRAFRAPRDGVYAKTSGPLNLQLLGGYRHEFGSLSLVQGDPRLTALDPGLQDLVLHLIAAHHGHARPVISTAGCEDAPPSALQLRAREVALRFMRLQERWGPWGLAYWEALLRAADQRASRRNDGPDQEQI